MKDLLYVPNVVRGAQMQKSDINVQESMAFPIQLQYIYTSTQKHYTSNISKYAWWCTLERQKYGKAVKS